MNRYIFFFIILFFTYDVHGRSFDSIFSIVQPAKTQFRLLKSSDTQKRDDFYSMQGTKEFDKNKLMLLDKKPSAILDMITVISSKKNKSINLIDIYNATLRVSNLAGRAYFSHTRKKEVPLFKKASRVQGENTKDFVPAKEAADIIVDDINLGECYYHTELLKTEYGMILSISNSKPLSVLFVTVIKKEEFNIIFYIEPVNEGIVVYGIMGMTAEEFAASKFDITSAARKRFEVITDWLIEGIGNG